MDIIESWVDESEIRKYAKLLIESDEKGEADDADFIVADSEAGNAVRNLATAEKVELAGGNVDQVLDSLSSAPPVFKEDGGTKKALSALKDAAKLASKSGMISQSDSNNESDSSLQLASSELRQHLGESQGAIVDRESVVNHLSTLEPQLLEKWQCHSICISDRDGDILLNNFPYPAWSRLTISVTEPIRLLDIQQGAIGHGYIHLQLSAELYLQVVVCSTPYGLVVVGMVRDEPLRVEKVKELVSEIRSMS